MKVEDALRLAVFTARQSRCVKSKRGVVVFDPLPDGRYFAAECNRRWESCLKTESCIKNCGKTAIHAEQAAIYSCLRQGIDLSQVDMIHARIDEKGELAVSRGPSCYECSKLILEVQLGAMWLWEEAGLVKYTAEQFHHTTLHNCGLL